jgi:hypothetical protein
MTVFLSDKKRRAISFAVAEKRLSKSDLDSMRANFFRQFLAWRKCQQQHLPAFDDDDDITSANDIEVELIALRLPSACVDIARRELIEIEIKLRLAQVDDALFELRRLLRHRQQVTIFKKQHAYGSGNAVVTRARSAQESVTKRIERAADNYRVARTALLVLQPESNHVQNLKPLTKNDIKGPQPEQTDDVRPSEGSFKPSWIWTTATDSRDAEDNDALRHDWVRMKARRDRWNEEIQLLLEEMRRTVSFLRWQGQSWERKVNVRSVEDPLLQSGLSAHARRQAHIRHTLSDLYLKEWNVVIQSLSLPTLACNG